MSHALVVVGRNIKNVVIGVNMFEYYYANNTEKKRNPNSGLLEGYYTVFKVKVISTSTDAQARCRTFANKKGIGLAGGSFTENSMPSMFEKRYTVIEVLDDVVPYVEPKVLPKKRLLFYEKIDKRSRKDMVEFLNGHFNYYTMGSWNLTKGFAHNVKLYNIDGIENEDIAYKLIYGVDLFWISDAIEDWEAQWHNLSVFFNGRQGGYIVLDTKDSREAGGIYWEEDFECLDIEELRSITEVVQSFDKLCDDIVDGFVNQCNSYKLIDNELEER